MSQGENKYLWIWQTLIKTLVFYIIFLFFIKANCSLIRFSGKHVHRLLRLEPVSCLDYWLNEPFRMALTWPPSASLRLLSFLKSCLLLVRDLPFIWCFVVLALLFCESHESLSAFEWVYYFFSDFRIG